MSNSRVLTQRVAALTASTGRLGAILALAVCAALSGCGSASHSGAAAHAGASLAHLKSIAIRRSPPAAVKPVDSATADFVAAVGDDKAALPVEVRFALRGRPEVGKPVELDILVKPTGPMGRLVTSFHAEDGLAIQDGGAPSETDRPEPGVALTRALTIVAQRDGLYYVKATVLVDAGADSVARTFTIPVIAGGGAS